MINVTGCRNRAAGHMRFTTKMPLVGIYLFSQLQGPNSGGTRTSLSRSFDNFSLSITQVYTESSCFYKWTIK